MGCLATLYSLHYIIKDEWSRGLAHRKKVIGMTSDFPSGGLKITGKETSDIVVVVSLSTNKSFEWIEVVNDGRWAPSKGEQVADMGIRGMKLKLL